MLFVESLGIDNAVHLEPSTDMLALGEHWPLVHAFQSQSIRSRQRATEFPLSAKYHSHYLSDACQAPFTGFVSCLPSTVPSLVSNPCVPMSMPACQAAFPKLAACQPVYSWLVEGLAVVGAAVGAGARLWQRGT
jgi:hypothetical protein